MAIYLQGDSYFTKHFTTHFTAKKGINKTTLPQ